MKILVTGAAGFIGYHLSKKLLLEGHTIIGLDNVNDYYDPKLKLARLEQLGIRNLRENILVSGNSYGDRFKFIKLNLEDKKNINKLCQRENFDSVCNLAAQAGVRYSIENPDAYIQSNIVGFLNVLEACRNHNIKKLVYASSSSVYGLNHKIPFSTGDSVDNPVSIYAATKKSNELMAHTYSHLFGLETIGLRFFTVYGPWGRPDMAPSLFTDAIFNNKPIKVFNMGKLSRDFTYIDDIVSGITSTLTYSQNPERALYNIYNIGNNKPIKLMDFISEIEEATNKVAEKDFLPMQPGDVEKTWADISEFERDFGYKPSTGLAEGIKQYIKWYRDYHAIYF